MGPAWREKNGSARIRMKFNSIQRVAKLKTTKYYRTAATNAKQLLAGTITLDIIAKTEVMLHQFEKDERELRLGGV